MSRSNLLIVAAMILSSCAHSPPAPPATALDSSDLEWLYPALPGGAAGLLEISAGVRIDVPKYRVRGTCGILWDGRGGLRIDFVHSSLFGSYREEATIIVSGGKITIIDHEREIVRGTRESLALLEERFGIEVFPDDIPALLLLAPPADSLLSRAGGTAGEGLWRLEGIWSGRSVVMRGETGKGPVRVDLCSEGGGACYAAEYRWGGAQDDTYPEKIVIQRQNGTERLSMEVRSVESRGPAGGPGNVETGGGPGTSTEEGGRRR